MSVKKITAPKKIEIEIEALDKSINHYELIELTDAKQKALSEIDSDLRADKINPGQALQKQCAVFFEKDESEFINYDIRILMQVVSFITSEIKNPS